MAAGLWYAPWRTSRLGLALVMAAHLIALWAAFTMHTVHTTLPSVAAAPVLSVSLLSPDTVAIAPAPPAPAKPTAAVPTTPQRQPLRPQPPTPLLAAAPGPAPAAAPQPEAASVSATAEGAPTAAASPDSHAAAAPPAIQPARFDAAYLDNPRPVYPLLARRMGEQGRVLLRVSVDAHGKPLDVQLHASSGSPRLDQAAAEAVRRWRFVPARHGNEAVAAAVIVPIDFSLKE